MNPSQAESSLEPEVVEVSALDTIERAQIDMQIATARKFPRSIAQVKRNMLDFATLDTETAQGCFYTLPGRKGGNGKPIQGPSVRLAEIAIASYGNLRAGMRIVGNDGKFITAQGFVHDLEKNISVAMEVRRRITKRDGSTYGEDMQQVAGAAACSVAFRNAVFKVVPLALIKPVYDKCLQVAAGDEKSLAARRVECIKQFDALGVKRDQLFASVGAKGVDDINNDRLLILIGFWNAIKDGETTIAEVFEPQADETAAPKTDGGLAKADKAPAPKPAPSPAPAPKAEPEQGESATVLDSEVAETAAAAEATAPAAPAPDQSPMKKTIINAIEGWALDLDLTLTNLFEMLGTPTDKIAGAKLLDHSIPQLVTLKAKLEKLGRERKTGKPTA